MRLALILLLTVACGGKTAKPKPATAVTQTPSAGPDTDAPLLKLDPRVQTGQLANGLTYYVLQVDRSDDGMDDPPPPDEGEEGGVEGGMGGYDYDGGARYGGLPQVAMVIQAGTDDETPEQKGAAARLGDAFYPFLYSEYSQASDHTTVSFDHTVVRPMADTVDGSLELLRKVADGVKWDEHTYDNAYDKMQRAKMSREMREQFDKLERQQKRDPHQHDDTSAFYRTWYRPDRMAVVVITDHDATATVRMIERRFASLKKPATPVPARRLQPRPAKPGLTVTADPDGPHFKLTQRAPHHRGRGERGFRAQLVQRFVRETIEERFELLVEGLPEDFEIAVKQVDADQDELTMLLDYRLGVDYPHLLREIERLRQHGVDADELADWKERMARPGSEGSYETMLSRLVEHARGDGGFPGRDTEAAVAAALTLDEVNAAFRSMLLDQGRTITLGPDMTAEASVEEVRTTVTALRSAQLERWNDMPHRRPLVEITAPGTAKLVKRDAGLAIYELSNGARAIVKSDPDLHSVHVQALGPGGWSRAPSDLALEHWSSVEIVLWGGLGGMTHAGFLDAVRGRSFNLDGIVWRNSHYVHAWGQPDRLEPMLQALHLAFMKPRKDVVGFGGWQGTVRWVAPEEMPLREMTDKLDMLAGEHPTPMLTETAVAKIDLDRAYDAYLGHVGDMATTTFVVVGTIDDSKIEGFLAKYLASIRTTGNRITIKPRVPVKPKLAATATVAGSSDTIVLQYIGQPVKKDVHVVDRNMFELQMALLRTVPGVREVAAGVAPDGRPYLRITAAGEPVPSEKDIQKVIDGLATTVDEETRSYAQTSALSPEHWIEGIERAAARGEDPVAMAVYMEKRLNGASNDAGIKAAAKLFKKPVVIVRGK